MCMSVIGDDKLKSFVKGVIYCSPHIEFLVKRTVQMVQMEGILHELSALDTG